MSMSSEEKTTWFGTLVTVGVLAYYSATTLPELSTIPVRDVAYQATMLWTIGISIGVTIVGAIIASIASEDQGKRDQRDKEIARRGDLAGYFVLVVAALLAMGLAMTEQEPFWIANALFYGFVLSGLVSGIAKLVAYRRGL